MKTRLNLNFLLGIMLLPGCLLWAQQPIFFTNPSFEANPGYSRLPGGWQNCAFNQQSPPDVHPVPNGSFRVVQQPRHGDSYLGLVARENASTEAVGQKLSTPLQKGHCYTFSIWLCRSEHLFSPGVMSDEVKDFSLPIALNVWGGVSPCGQKVLLATSPSVENLEWRKFTFQFQSPDSLSYLSFEASFADTAQVAYNGNILLDNLSPIVPLSCETLQPLVNLDTVQVPVFEYRKLPSPESGVPSRYVLRGGNYFAVFDFLAITDPGELEALVESKCDAIGFRKSNGKWTEFEQLPLMEIGFNLKNFPAYRLTLAIPDVDKKLNNRRIKTLRQALRNVGLPLNQFEIIVEKDPENLTAAWLCGQGEVWLKLNKT